MRKIKFIILISILVTSCEGDSVISVKDDLPNKNDSNEIIKSIDTSKVKDELSNMTDYDKIMKSINASIDTVKNRPKFDLNKHKKENKHEGSFKFNKRDSNSSNISEFELDVFKGATDSDF